MAFPYYPSRESHESIPEPTIAARVGWSVHSVDDSGARDFERGGTDRHPHRPARLGPGCAALPMIGALPIWILAPPVSYTGTRYNVDCASVADHAQESSQANNRH